MGNAHRDKIKNSNILMALIQHAEGEREMTGSQVQAGLGLLKKVLPDLQPVDPDTGKGGFTIHIPKDTRSL